MKDTTITMESVDLSTENVTTEEPACKKIKLDAPGESNNIQKPCKEEDAELPATVVDNEKCIENKNGIQLESEIHEKEVPITEIQAGITEYLGEHEGFSAVIKQRYSDFIVNEVDLDGNEVHLTQMTCPVEETDEDKKAEDNNDKIVLEKPDVISDEDLSKIDNLVKTGDKTGTVNIIAPECKDLRTKMHLAIKKTFSELETKTIEEGGKKYIQVLWRSAAKSRDKFQDDWPKSQRSCRFVKFVLYKENKDTMDAIGLIAKNLRLKESLFQFAGTKDRRAKTSQEVTANRIHPKKLVFLNKILRNMGLGNFRYVAEPLKLGQLSGNTFTIVLRNVQGSTETVDNAISSLKANGFINYFGMQRFGTTSVPTHKVGCALLHGDWEKAIDLILQPRDDNASKDGFQKIWKETRNPEKTLAATPKFCGLERNLLEALKRNMKPFNALEKISRNTRLLYVHSYQALIWNLMVSKRLQKFGKLPIIGDLVLPANLKNEEHATPLVVTQDNLDQYTLHDVCIFCLTEHATPLVVTQDNLDQTCDSYKHATPLVMTQENLDQYTLHDVVLPLPGHDVIYPKNEVFDWYKSALAADGLDIDNMKRTQKDYSLPGAYRHVTLLPKNVTWSHHNYDDYTLPITLSDLDLIKEVQLPPSDDKGSLKAVVLKLTLPSSCYATMALREVLKIDTSAAHQTTLNVK
ncbi:pseudouridylate synthase 7 homolog [Physella acuta]|uniref:pseudouridylate synthase 7 homolog n=1 Tax=Physella acuta TaxID=109671 RepID=UPI0027DE8387|nr:pseudouridylate synthase 7 homolog [Physella acuta]